MDPQETLRLLLGGVVVEFHSPPGPTRLSAGGAYRSFLTDAPAEVEVGVHWGPAPEASGARVAFDAGAWQYARAPGGAFIRGELSQLGEPRGRYTLVMPPGGPGVDPAGAPGRVELYLENAPVRDGALELPLCPFDEVLAVHLLAGGRGLLLHACGLELDGRGLLFCGVSGEGKSTMAALWQAHEPRAVLYSDERVPVRPARDGSGYRLHTSYWLGRDRSAAGAALAPMSAPLERIYVLKHASHNYAAPLPVAAGVRGLLQRAFLPYWDQGGMAYSLQEAEALCRQAPCRELGFVPDESVVELVRKEMGGGGSLAPYR